MIARVGDDLFGEATIRNFKSAGIDTAHVSVTKGASSGVAPIFVDSSGQNRIIVVKGANDLLTPADIDAAAEVLRGADMIVLQLEVPVETVYHTLRFARAHGIPSILNPAPGQPLDLAQTAQADYIIPNETEAEALTGIAVHDLESARACERQLLSNGASRVIITLGANGALCAGEHIRAFPVDAVDTTGAGDAFIGSFAAFLAGGIAERDAIARANLYAALSTLSVGTQKSLVSLDRFEMEWTKRCAAAGGR
jgi:ribokinase